MPLFVDSSMFYAAVDRGDRDYERAKHLLEGEQGLTTTDHVLVETWLLLHHRIGRPPAGAVCEPPGRSARRPPTRTSRSPPAPASQSGGASASIASRRSTTPSPCTASARSG